MPILTGSNCLAGALLIVTITASSPSVYAADLNGAWASDASVCSKVFVKNENTILFAPDSELYGGGLIIEGNRASGSFQKCKIKSMHDDGSNVHVIAACSDGVMVQELRFDVKVVDHNQITLSSGGSVSAENPLTRCSM
jgi:hypothetical protein